MGKKKLKRRIKALENEVEGLRRFDVPAGKSLCGVPDWDIPKDANGLARLVHRVGTVEALMAALKERVNGLKGQIDKAHGTANTALEVAGNTAARLEKAMPPRGVTFVPSVIDHGTAVPAQFKGVT